MHRDELKRERYDPRFHALASLTANSRVSTSNQSALCSSISAIGESLMERSPAYSIMCRRFAVASAALSCVGTVVDPLIMAGSRFSRIGAEEG